MIPNDDMFEITDNMSRSDKENKKKGTNSMDEFVENKENLSQKIRYSTMLKDKIIELIRDSVYAKKIQGNFYATQDEIIEEAMNDYKLKHNIQPRPEEAKEMEKRGRKK